MPGRDALHFQIFRGIASQLQHFGRQVFHDGGRVHGGCGAHALVISHTFLQEAVDTAHGKLDATHARILSVHAFESYAPAPLVDWLVAQAWLVVSSYLQTGALRARLGCLLGGHALATLAAFASFSSTNNARLETQSSTQKQPPISPIMPMSWSIQTEPRAATAARGRS